LKKILSIFLLLLYVNAAFGIGLACHYCGERLVKVTILGPGHETCKCTSGAVSGGCCHDKTFFCKTDQHKIQAITQVLPFLSAGCPASHPATGKVELSDAIVVPSFKTYYFKWVTSSRDILARIHTLRI
jgi:hypothetical protein